MKTNISLIFEDLKNKIEEIYKNDYKLQELLENIVNQIESNEELKEIVSELKLFVSMLRDYFEGRYKGLAKENVYLIIGAFIYIMSPIDLLPDFLFFGYLDDILIIMYLMKKMSKEIEKYRIWKENEDNIIFVLEKDDEI